VGPRKINHSTALAGQDIGIKEVTDKIWLSGALSRSIAAQTVGTPVRVAR
jgi:hypothetical protein